MMSEAEIEAERLLNNVKKEVKQIMEEAVTKKFIYEESNCILALCSAVEACLLHLLKKRVLGLFRNNSTVALLQKASKTFEPAAIVLKQLQDIESAATADSTQSSSRKSDGNIARSPSLPRRSPTNPRYLWIRLALFEKQLSLIIEHLAENATKFYEPEALMCDPVRAAILSSLLVGPCALDYTRVKTADNYWTDPPAEELLQRHRIQGTTIARTDSPKRPGLQISIRRHPSWTSEDNVRSSPSAKEYVASLHQNNKSTLLYGKNNVIVQPKEDVEPLAGYLSLHQLTDSSVLLKWMPNQLMNGCCDNTKDDTDRSLFWDYAVLVNLSDIVYLHCHQPVVGGGLLVMVGQDGVQRPPIEFPRGGHLLAFLSCLENGLQPSKCLDPPLWSQRGKGKVFPKLKRKTSRANGGQSTTLTGGSKSSDDSDSIDCDVNDCDEVGATATDYVFRIINFQSHNSSVTQSAVAPSPIPFFWHVWMTPPIATTMTSIVQTSGINTISSKPESNNSDQSSASHRLVVKQLCDTMARQIVSRAFYGWLSYCRQLKTVRTHLSGLVISLMPDEETIEINEGITECVWDRLCPQGVVINGAELYRRVYYGGCVHSLRRTVWLYLLGHYEVGGSMEEQQAKDLAQREQYEKVMSEWMAVEAIVRQREQETQAVMKAMSESQDSPNIHLALQHKDSTLSNEVFESVDSDSGDFIPCQATLTEESPSDNNVPIISNGYSVHLTDSLPNDTSAGLSSDKARTPMKSIIVTNASIDQTDCTSVPTTLELGLTPLAECNEHLSMSKESLVLPASPQSNTSHGGVYSTELLDSVALNLHRIDKDVQRCDRNYPYFIIPGNLNKLRNVVSTYVWQHLDIGYMQGMCDLVAPLLVVFDDECYTYSCFNHLMKRMINNFPSGSMMDQHFANMRSLIQILDPELFEHMHQTGDFTHFYFCYRWFLLDFKRELTYEGTFATWEAIWAAKYVSSSHFVLFIALALVELYREIILDNHMDFTDVIKFFNEMAEHHDAREVLKLARSLVQRLQLLIENK